MGASILSVPQVINAGAPALAFAPRALLIDTLSIAPIIAYSSRKLRSGYGGKALQIVTSASGNATQDIGFDSNNEIDPGPTGPLATFIGSNTGGISIWHDQSGNGYDATYNGTVGDTYVVDSSGTVQTQNGHVWAAGVANLSNLAFPSTGFTTQPWSVAYFGSFAGGAGSQLLSNGASGAAFLVNKGVSHFGLQAGSSISGGTPDTAIHSFFYIFNGATSSIVMDGTTIASGNAGTNFPTAAGNIGNFNGSVNIGELMFFNNVAIGTADQALIRSSWQSWWGAP